MIEIESNSDGWQDQSSSASVHELNRIVKINDQLWAHKRQTQMWTEENYAPLNAK